MEGIVAVDQEATFMPDSEYGEFIETPDTEYGGEGSASEAGLDEDDWDEEGAGVHAEEASAQEGIEAVGQEFIDTPDPEYGGEEFERLFGGFVSEAGLGAGAGLHAEASAQAPALSAEDLRATLQLAQQQLAAVRDRNRQLQERAEVLQSQAEARAADMPAWMGVVPGQGIEPDPLLQQTSEALRVRHLTLLAVKHHNDVTGANLLSTMMRQHEEATRRSRAAAAGHSRDVAVATKKVDVIAKEVAWLKGQVGLKQLADSRSAEAEHLARVVKAKQCLSDCRRSKEAMLQSLQELEAERRREECRWFLLCEPVDVQELSLDKASRSEKVPVDHCKTISNCDSLTVDAEDEGWITDLLGRSWMSMAT